MISPRQLSETLAAAVAAGEWSEAGSLAAMTAAIPAPAPEKRLRRLAAILHAAFSGFWCPAPSELVRAIEASAEFLPLLDLLRRRGAPLPAVLESPRMAVPARFADLDLPGLDTAGDLADWLGVLPFELDRYADADGRLARRGPDARRHYTCRWLPKRSGGLRLIEAPKPRLRRLQRRVLHGILDLVPPHPDAFGFVRGRNCLMGAQRHAGEEVVICVDLKDFFLSIPAPRVHALFRALGFPWQVARALTGLCTVSAPRELLGDLPTEQRFRALPGRALAGPHLPQGAPTSPALANLAAWRLDRRLSGLARRMGAAYSRYADDITFSGPREIAFEGARPLIEILDEIAAEERFRLNPAKTRIQRQGRRQVVTGVVVNRHLNLRRADYDRLKAILHNCRRHGPAGQNRAGHPAFRAHLEGRVAWAEAVNPRRGARLRALFEAVDWGP